MTDHMHEKARAYVVNIHLSIGHMVTQALKAKVTAETVLHS